MSFYSLKTLTKQLDDENSVTVRLLAYGEEQSIKQRCMKMRAGMDGQGEMTFDAIQMQTLTLHTSIVSWDGPGFEGRAVTPENIDALPSTVVDLIVEAVNEVNAPLGELEKKQSPGHMNGQLS